MKVVVYTTPNCGYCHQVKAFLSQKGVKYTEHNVSVDRAAAEEMVRKTGQMGVPVIIIDNDVVVGFDRARLEQLLSSGSGNGKHPHFGLKIADASKMTRKAGLVPVFGAFVGRVAPASPGEKAGLRPGDIITKVNISPVRNADDLEKILAGISGGSRMTIVFLREQETLRTEIVL